MEPTIATTPAATIFDLLAAIEKQPEHYLVIRDISVLDRRRRQLDDLEMLIAGYDYALSEHVLHEHVDFLRDFMQFLRDKVHWDTGCGPTFTIKENTSTDEEAWTTFWRLTWEFHAAWAGKCHRVATSQEQGKASAGGDIFGLMAKVEKRASMYVGWDPTMRGRQLESLEMVIVGYRCALAQHSIVERVDFSPDFSKYLRERYG